MSRTKPIERIEISLLKASEGGMSRADACALLRAKGVVGVKYAHSPYVGHYGLSIPKRFGKRAARLLFR